MAVAKEVFLNEYDRALNALDLTPYQKEWCCVCGKKRQHGHHVIPRSHGGKKRHVISLCAKCHSDVHQRRIRLYALGGCLAATPRSGDDIWDLSFRADFYERMWKQ